MSNNNRELSQFASRITVDDTTNKVSIASTLELSGGADLEVDGDVEAGAGTFAGNIASGDGILSISNTGTWIQSGGGVYTRRAANSTDPVFQGGTVGAINNVDILASGAAKFADGKFDLDSNGRLNLRNDISSGQILQCYSGGFAGTDMVATILATGSATFGDPSSNASGSGTGGLQFTASNGQLDIVNTGSGHFLSCYNRNTTTITASISAAGTIYGTTKNFRIPHPLPSKKDTHVLVHSSIEGPQADLIYRGQVVLVDGKATVNIDTTVRMTEGTFEMLCTNVSCFTSNETDWHPVKGSVSGNVLTIESQDATCTSTVSWLVIGERKDQSMLDSGSTDENGRLITEPLKPVEVAAEEEEEALEEGVAAS